LKNLENSEAPVLISKPLFNLVFDKETEDSDEELMQRGVHFVGKSKKPRPSFFMNPDKKVKERMIEFLLK